MTNIIDYNSEHNNNLASKHLTFDDGFVSSGLGVSVVTICGSEGTVSGFAFELVFGASIAPEYRDLKLSSARRIRSRESSRAMSCFVVWGTDLKWDRRELKQASSSNAL